MTYQHTHNKLQLMNTIGSVFSLAPSLWSAHAQYTVIFKRPEKKYEDDVTAKHIALSS